MRLSLRTRRKGVRPSFVATHFSPPSVDRQLVRPLSRFSESRSCRRIQLSEISNAEDGLSHHAAPVLMGGARRGGIASMRNQLSPCSAGSISA